MKKLMALFLAAAMMVSMTACGGSEPAAEGGNAAETEKVLFIGGTGPLTGDYATYGTSVILTFPPILT